jgi:hypothetical protein
MTDCGTRSDGEETHEPEHAKCAEEVDLTRGLGAGGSEKKGDPEGDDGDEVHAVPGLTKVSGLFDELFLLPLDARVEGCGLL